MSLDPALKTKLDQIIASDPVVLFMKGTRSFPQCGFSASVVNILNTLIPKYTTVNVLSDPDIRDGIKQYSDWPTIPQLYVRGEFVGGADIVKQLHASGDLTKKLGDLVKPAAPPSVTVTERAASELKGALAENAPTDVIHLTITPAWEHQLDLGPRDPARISIDVAGITVQVDPASAARAGGVVIDFVDGPSGAGFKIDNPNRPPQVQRIGAKELKAKLDAGAIKELWDVRTAKEREIAAIAQSRLLDDAGMAYIEGLPKDTPLAFFCHHGPRSRNAAEHFVAQGFTQVYNLDGGLDAWSVGVDPAVKRY
jgi:monothiol glutaredoxin